jgi:hypothetical protein
LANVAGIFMGFLKIRETLGYNSGWWFGTFFIVPYIGNNTATNQN